MTQQFYQNLDISWSHTKGYKLITLQIKAYVNGVRLYFKELLSLYTSSYGPPTIAIIEIILELN